MPSPPTPRLLCALLLLGSLGSLPCAPAHAQHFLVRTRTLGRATQSWRIDGSVRADRPLIQGIELYGHDLTGTRTDTLSAKVALRYRTSLDRLGLAAGGDTRQLEIEGLVVDLFSVTFAPAEGAARLTLGRQWHQSALGAVEIDGAQAQGMVGSPESVALELTAFGGRHPLREGRLLAGSNLDVQALPLELEDQTTSWSAGAALRLWKDRFFSASGAYSRRQITSVPQAPGGQALGAEVLAGAMTLEPASFLLLSSTLRAHPTLGRIERAEARADAAFDLAASKLALGLALGGGRWRPVFDLSSIFNLFDPQPHDELWARAHARAFGAHALTLKAWGRRYGIDQGRGDVALGGALSYALALDLLGLPWRWDSTLSTERGADAIGGSPSMVDTALSVSWLQGKLTTQGRLIGLLIDRDHHRLRQEAALSGILGVGAEVFEGGTLNVLLEQRQSRNDVTSAGVWALWTMEFDP